MQDTDVVVIGAGAAGIAAARQLATHRVSAIVVEARSRVGGRAWTSQVAGLPLDLGCGWLHSADENEWSTIAKELGLAIDPLPPPRSEEHTSELQSRPHLVCRLLLEKKKKKKKTKQKKKNKQTKQKT